MVRNTLALLAFVVFAPHAMAADAVRGAERFRLMCATCHGVAPAEKKMSVHLKGVIGRKAAAVEGAAYSAALKASGWTWNKAKLDAYLADPRKALPGTTMMMGASNAIDRADIIAYLETLK